MIKAAPPATGISPGTARLTLVLLAALLVAGIFTSIPPQPASADPSRSDAGFHVRVAERVRSGESYYTVLGAELRARAYPSASVFNWRMPLVLVAYAYSPGALTILLVGCGVMSIVVTAAFLRNVPPEATLLGVIVQVGAAASVVLVYASATVAEVWVGYIVLASVVAYASGRCLLGATLAVLGLFVRELMAPYVVLCVLRALYERRKSEVALFVAGGVAFSVYYAAHVSNVLHHIGPQDVVQRNSWIQFGGLPFVLGTMSFNGWFAVSQPWGPSLGCVLVIAALFSRAAPWHLRICGPAYLVFFAIVGQQFNQNWGLVASPTWALACGYGIQGLTRLVRSAARRGSA